jgi:glycerol uptake facilitator protein
MIFGEFFPNPGGQPLTATARATVSMPTAFLVESLGTGILMLVIFGSVDERNTSRPQILTAATIGLTVTILISLLGPLTMAAFNPARDLAPRLFSSMAGWGWVPFDVNGYGWLTVYVLAPILGAVLGGGVYRTWLAPNYTQMVREIN